MPVVGHAFAGWATGIATTSSAATRAPGRDYWVPAAVVLAYFPDLAAQMMLMAGQHHAYLVAHSLVFALFAACVLTPLVRALGRPSWPRAGSVTFLSILGHDLLDVAQATDREPFWPVSDYRLHIDWIPKTASQEAVWSLLAFLAFLLTRHLLQGRAPSSPPARSARSVLTTRAAVCTLILAAAGTHGLRATREKQLYRAHSLLALGDYRSALHAAEQASLWPSTAKPGRLDYLRAEAYALTGNSQRAEEHYLRAYDGDPDYFWCIADLALYYASSDRPLGERRRLAGPYRTRLAQNFGKHGETQSYLKKIDHALQLGP